MHNTTNTCQLTFSSGINGKTEACLALQAARGWDCRLFTGADRRSSRSEENQVLMSRGSGPAPGVKAISLLQKFDKQRAKETWKRSYAGHATPVLYSPPARSPQSHRDQCYGLRGVQRFHAEGGWRGRGRSRTFVYPRCHQPPAASSIWDKLAVNRTDPLAALRWCAGVYDGCPARTKEARINPAYMFWDRVTQTTFRGGRNVLSFERHHWTKPWQASIQVHNLTRHGCSAKTTTRNTCRDKTFKRTHVWQ